MFKKIINFFSDLTKSVVLSVIGSIITLSALLGFYGKIKTFLGDNMNFFLWLLIISLFVMSFFILDAILSIGKPPYRPKKFAYTLGWRRNREGVLVPLCKKCGDFAFLSSKNQFGFPEYFCEKNCRSSLNPRDPLTGDLLDAASVHRAMNSQ